MRFDAFLCPCGQTALKYFRTWSSRPQAPTNRQLPVQANARVQFIGCCSFGGYRASSVLFGSCADTRFVVDGSLKSNKRQKPAATTAFIQENQGRPEETALTDTRNFQVRARTSIRLGSCVIMRFDADGSPEQQITTEIKIQHGRNASLARHVGDGN